MTQRISPFCAGIAIAVPSRMKAKLAKAKDDAKLKSWLDAMGNHIGNADDYLK